MAKKGAPGSAGRWGDDAWEEQNWDSVRKQEQMKQEVLIKASGNSERIRQMVRETEVTRSIGSETLQVLDQQSGEIQMDRAQIRRRLVWGSQNEAKNYLHDKWEGLALYTICWKSRQLTPQPHHSPCRATCPDPRRGGQD
jgi:hypothetical protein